MKPIVRAIRRLLLAVLALSGSMAPTFAQEVFIPDPALNAVIREAAIQLFPPRQITAIRHWYVWRR